MFAVIKTGGKQYSVAAEDQLKVEKLAGEPGEMIELTEVMMVGETVGTPFVEGAMVTAEIVEQGRARKVIAFKKRRRQNSRRTIGHRQHYTLLQISEILTDGKKPSKKATGAAKKTKEPKVKDAAKEKADKKADAKAEKPASTAAAKSEKTDKKEADADKKKAEKPAAKADKKEADKSAAKADAQASAKKDDAKPAAKEKAKADAAPLFKSPAKGEKDKLTDLKGVGPVAEKQLNEQGITTFAQIAALTDAEITTIDENMPFSADQIKDWQAQAKEKAKG